MVKDIAFCAYSVKDVPAATKFYRDIIGLTPGQSFGDHWVEFNVGSTAFGVGDGTPLGFIPGTSTSSCRTTSPSPSSISSRIARPVSLPIRKETGLRFTS
jgi:catechol 2,3-dioxygenase-like lactoylglutathione lyase family enzyme